MGSTTTFKLFRYQLLPIDRHTDDLYDGMTTSELLERKNDIFSQAIRFVERHRHRGSDLSVQVEGPQDDAFVLKIAPRRALTRETPEFRTEQIENWPHVTAIVLNRPDEQLIAVQNRTVAFNSTSTVVNIIQAATRTPLARAGLRLHIEHLFNQEDFWSVLKQYEGKVTLIEFELVTPNMANISNTLAETFKDLAKDTNASQSNVKLRSDPASALHIDPANPKVKGLVDYASEGGGDITIQVKGVRKRIQTSSAIRETEMDDLQLSGPASQVAAALRDILK